MPLEKMVLGDPRAVAETFATSMAMEGLKFDFSLESLHIEIDRMLTRVEQNTSSVPLRLDELCGLDADVVLAAYIGETLCRLFNGVWCGEFHLDSTSNFYTSGVKFGGYSYSPIHFISYRLNNGPCEGPFTEHIDKVLAKIQHANRWGWLKNMANNLFNY